MREPDFDVLAPAVERALAILIPVTTLRLVNVNFPDGPPRGIRWTCQSVRHYDGDVVAGRDPMGRPHFWFVVKPLEPADTDTDRWAVEHGLVSMTPLRLDLTDEERLQQAHETVSLE